MRFKRILCASLFFTGIFPAQYIAAQENGVVPAATEQETGAARHLKAITEARNGHHIAALIVLENLRKEFPDNLLYLHDYICVAAWAGKYQLAIDTAHGLIPENLPDYVLIELVKALRKNGEGEKAIKFYLLLEERNPADIQPKIGQLSTLLELNRNDEALALARQLIKEHPQQAQIQELLLDSYVASGHWIEALDKAQMILQKEPENIIARRIQAIVLWRLGAPHAAEWAAPESLNEEERADLLQAQKAFEVRWAHIAAKNEKDPHRWQMLNNLIEEMAQLADDLEARGHLAAAHRMRADRLVAMRYRLRFANVVAQYPKTAEKGKMPSYARQIYASALTEFEEPETAAKIFSEEIPFMNLDANRTYVLSLMEVNQHDKAIEHIDNLHEDEWNYENIPALRIPNENYPQLLIAQSFARSAKDLLEEGQIRLETLRQRAPANTDINEALATTYHYRGWDHRAEDLHTWVLGAEPEYHWSRLGRYENRRSLTDYQGAYEDLQKVQAVMPEDPQVIRASRRWDVHMMRELKIEGYFGRSSDTSSDMLGSRDRGIDAWLYSSSFAYNWRAFAHTHYTTANFDEDTSSRTAQGIGIEYRQRYWYASVETYALRSQGMGLSLDGSWQPDDHWSLNAAYVYKALDTPLRAYADGIDTQGFDLSAVYRWHESRQVSIGAQTRNFSDSNDRHSLFAAWTERIINGPIYKLDARVDLYMSRNSLDADKASYFNPRRDRSQTLTLLHEWTQISRYQRTLKHRVQMGIGNYWQKDYGSGGIALLRYEIAYAPDDRTEFRIGIGRIHRPYDGEKSNQDEVDFSINWRF